MNVPSFSVDRRVTTTMLFGILVVIGGMSVAKIGLEMFPEMEYPVITVSCTYPGASSEDVERLVTKPLEEAIATVKNIKDIKSFSLENYSIITAEFEWGSNLDYVAEDIRNTIALIREIYLPEDITTPSVQKFDMSQMPVMYYFFSADTMNEVQLRAEIDDVVKDRLERLDGVAAAMVFGGREREMQVLVDRARLESMKVSLSNVVAALGAENITMPAGHLDINRTEYLLRTTGEFKEPQDMQDVVVGSTGNQPVYLKDVARVVDTHKEIRNYIRAQGNPGVILAVAKESGANTLAVCDKVKAEMEELKKVLPSGVNFYVGLDQGQIIRLITSNTGKTGIMGALLAMLLTYLFLRAIRPTLIIGLSIPLSIAATFIPLYLADYTLNFMTIGGLALGVGMVVDNAVVVIENIFRHMELGKSSKEAAKVGASEVAMAITASTMTTVAVFLPLAFAGGLTGQLSQPLSLTVASALLASLLVAITIVPMLASVFFKEQSKDAKLFSQGGRWFTAFQGAYVRFLRWSLDHKKKLFATVGAAFVASLLLGLVVGAEFMPGEDHPMNFLSIKLPVGTTLDETDRLTRIIEKEFMKQPEVLVVGSNVGTDDNAKSDIASGMQPAGVNEAMIMARLSFKQDRTRSAEEIMDGIRQVLPKAHGAEYFFTDMGKSMSGGSAAPIEVKLFGKNIPELMKYADEIAQTMASVDGVKDIRVSLKEGKPEYHVVVDRHRAAKYGINTLVGASSIKTGTIGQLASRMRINDDEIDIRVRMDDPYRETLEDINNIPIASPLGLTIPMKQVADMNTAVGPLIVYRENQSRVAYVRADFSKRSLSDVTVDIGKAIKPLEEKLPHGYLVQMGGQYEDMVEMIGYMAVAMLVAMLLIYMVMASQFESFRYPFIIMFTMPLAVIGVMVALFLAGKTFSVASGMGIVMLMGIVVNNAIVYVDYANQLRRLHGYNVRNALVEAGRVRLRPILITALTTIVGMVPMAFDPGQGNEMRSPMAISIIGGLFASTFLTLVIIPALYEWMTKGDKVPDPAPAPVPSPEETQAV